LRCCFPALTPPSVHSLVKRFPPLGLIIDLSKDEPPYLTEDPNIPNYTKLANTSKVVPPQEEVRDFISVASKFHESASDKEIFVHCHYGYNRTGFMICSYLIEKLGVPVSESIRRFETARPPGIKHQHFKDELYLRYTPTVNENPRGAE